mmetsp:Transcript_9198/g.27993  ORF Transcript_9198/g.27993 Transcript_9198/m.27993 type:complete len:578 (-) Transcript_9198:592-2325(-)
MCVPICVAAKHQWWWLTTTDPLVIILSTTREMRSGHSQLSRSRMVSRMCSSGSSLLLQPSNTRAVTTIVETVLLSVTECCRRASIISMKTSVVFLRMYSGSKSSNMRAMSATNKSGFLHVWRSDSARMEWPSLSPSWRVSARKKSTMLRWSAGFSSAVMPASSSTMCGLASQPACCSSGRSSAPRPPLLPGVRSRTRMLPGCRSAWQKLSVSSICRYRLRPVSARKPPVRLQGSGRDTYELMRLPSSNVSTSTSGATSGYSGRGKRTSDQRRKLWLKRVRWRASTDRSSCSLSGPPNCRIDSSSRRSATPGSRPAVAAARCISTKSRCIVELTPGWRTFTATSVPRAHPVSAAPCGDSHARCTCAMDPLATGAASNASKSGAPPACTASASPTTASDSAPSWLGAPDCSRSKREHRSRGKRSGRLLDHCAHLINAGPACSIVHSSRSIHAARPASAPRPSQKTAGAVSMTGVNSSARYSPRNHTAISSASAASTGGSGSQKCRPGQRRAGEPALRCARCAVGMCQARVWKRDGNRYAIAASGSTPANKCWPDRVSVMLHTTAAMYCSSASSFRARLW